MVFTYLFYVNIEWNSNITALLFTINKLEQITHNVNAGTRTIIWIIFNMPWLKHKEWIFIEPHLWSQCLKKLKFFFPKLLMHVHLCLIQFLNDLKNYLTTSTISVQFAFVACLRYFKRFFEIFNKSATHSMLWKSNRSTKKV